MGNWKEILKRNIQKHAPVTDRKYWNEKLRSANENMIETYKNISAIWKILNGLSFPNLTDTKFLEFLELIRVPENEKKEIIKGILKDKFGTTVTEEDFGEALNIQESLADFLIKNKEKARGQLYTLGIDKIISRNVKNPTKPERLVKAFGREIIPYLIKGGLNEEYIRLFTNKERE
ncbi:hypothetical protein [Desulfurobacterium sp.]